MKTPCCESRARGRSFATPCAQTHALRTSQSDASTPGKTSGPSGGIAAEEVAPGMDCSAEKTVLRSSTDGAFDVPSCYETPSFEHVPREEFE